MLQQLAQQYSSFRTAADAILKDPCCRDGNPRAQAKLEARIRSLGALETSLKPGKRGRYELFVYSLAGWDPQRDALIEPGDPIPEKPWICTLFQVIHGTGKHRGSRTGFVWLYLTHHCLSRSAQRWGVRTVADLFATITSIARVAIKYLHKRGLTNPRDAWFDTPPEGVRVPMPGSAKLGGKDVIVVEKHETRRALVVSTVLD
jgi:hypothetical protein